MSTQTIDVQKKLDELLKLAARKKNVLEYREIQEFFEGQPISVHEYEHILELLEKNGVDLLQTAEDESCFDGQEQEA